MANETPSANDHDMTCRLCGGNAVPVFRLRVLESHDVQYLKCESCESLQTERPYWMQEAYTTNLSLLDTGAGQRNLSNLAATYVVSRLLRSNNVVDFGGGDGLLCRLLRDYGINCFVTDKYAAATYARAFQIPNFDRPDILLAFEVFEHFENPASELKALFEHRPIAIVASTSIYSDHGRDWWYLAPEIGQHIFLYSAKALQYIAKCHGYDVLLARAPYILFVRSGVVGNPRRWLLDLALSKYMLRMVGAALRLMPARGVWSDFESLRTQKKPGGGKQ